MSLDVEIADARTLAGACRRVTEAASKAPESMSKRKAGESLGQYGSRLKARDAQIERGREAAKKKGKTTRSGKDAEFEEQHPRGRGGSWVVKAGGGKNDEDVVRAVQRKVGAGADGKFGAQTAAKVRAFQAKNGLKVDGIVGAQTLAAMAGKKGVKPGQAKASDWAEFAKRGKAAKGGRKAGRTVREALGQLADVDLEDVSA